MRRRDRRADLGGTSGGAGAGLAEGGQGGAPDLGMRRMQSGHVRNRYAKFVIVGIAAFVVVQCTAIVAGYVIVDRDVYRGMTSGSGNYANGSKPRSHLPSNYQSGAWEETDRFHLGFDIRTILIWPQWPEEDGHRYIFESQYYMGWPCPFLYGSSVEQGLGRHRGPVIRHSLVPLYVRQLSKGNIYDLVEMAIPFGVQWVGLAIDAAVSAVLGATFLFAFGGLRCMRSCLRRRAGRCPRCGYPIGVGDVCPECGESTAACP